MRKSRMLGLVLTVLGSLVASQPAAAQSFNAFLLIPGIPGSSLDERHKNWIDVLSLSQGLASIDPKKLLAACNLTVVKSLDVSGPLLWFAAASGQVFPETTIEVAKAGGTQAVFYVIRLANTKIVSIQSIVKADAFPVEQLVLSPESATLEIKEQRPDGSLGATVSRTIACAN
jgi:type VI secretion system secreted protein Hcp